MKNRTKKKKNYPDNAYAIHMQFWKKLTLQLNEITFRLIAILSKQFFSPFPIIFLIVSHLYY